MTVGGFEITRFVALTVFYLTVIDYANMFDVMVVVFVRNRQRIEGLRYLRPEFIFRVEYKHHRQRVTPVFHIALRLALNTEQGTEDNK